MRHKHIIWDWNGTLLNDAWLWHEVGNIELKKRGLPEISFLQYREAVSIPIVRFFERIGFDFSKYELSDVVKSHHDAYEARRHECRLHDGALKLLEDVRVSGRTQSILSAHPAESLLPAVQAAGIDRIFSHIIGRDGHHQEGKVEVAKRWMESSGKDRQDLIIIGDMEHDHDVATELGIDCFLIAHGYQTRKALESRGVPVLEDVTELRQKIIG